MLGAEYALLVVDAVEHVDRVIVSTGRPEDADLLLDRLRSYGVALSRDGLPGGAEIGDFTLPEVPAGSGRKWLAAPVFTESSRFGVLFVLGPVGRPAFVAEDHKLLVCLADTTGTGLDCAVASREAQQHSAWLSASAVIGEQLLTLNDGVVVVAQNIADQLCSTIAAHAVTVELPDLDDPALLEVRVAAGAVADELLHSTSARADTLAQKAIDNQRSLRAAGDGIRGPVLVVPFVDADQDLVGAVQAHRGVDAAPFTLADQVIAEDFTRHLSIALALAARRALEEELTMQRERDGIAERLQENVTQQLFSLGLQAQNIKRLCAASPDLAERLDLLIGDLDDTIRQVRVAV